MYCIIVESFKSIQFEGSFAGTPAHFIRFAGCNLNCSFCDTPEAKKSLAYNELKDLELEAFLQNISLKHVVLTGGEPTLQFHLLEIVDILIKAGHTVQIETNGTLPEILRKCKLKGAFITWSPKSLAIWKDAPQFKTNVNYATKQYEQIYETMLTSVCDEVKVVWGCISEFSLCYIAQSTRTRIPFSIQPLEKEGVYQNISQIMEYLYEHPWIKFSFQAQKALGVK